MQRGAAHLAGQHSRCPKRVAFARSLRAKLEVPKGREGDVGSRNAADRPKSVLQHQAPSNERTRLSATSTEHSAHHTAEHQSSRLWSALLASTAWLQPSGLKARSISARLASLLQAPAPFERVWLDARTIMILAGPILAQYLIAHSSYMIDTGFVGHLDEPALLSALVLGGSLAMATGYHVMCGLASASETLSGQAHGAANPLALSLTLQRSLAVCAAATVPITALWWHAEPILTALGQAPEIAEGAARYLRLTLPALYCYTVFDCVDKHLVAQGNVTPGVAITAASTALTPLYCWFFVNHLALQLDGAAAAYCASQLTSTALSLGYLAWRDRATAGSPQHVPLAPAAAALTGWRPYLALALPATLMACMEGWAVEVLIFLSGRLPNADVAVGVSGLCLQFSTLVWLSAASISSATATRIANALGKGDAAAAQRLAYTSLGLVLVSQSLIGLAAFHLREPLVGLMTNEPQVLGLTARVLPVLAVCFVFDGQNVVLSAVLRGAGRQWLGAGCNLVGWWGVGVPLAYYLALPAGLGVQGLWGGFAAASVLQAFVQGAVVSRLDWDGEVRRAGNMLRESTSGVGEQEGSELDKWMEGGPLEGKKES